MRDDESIRHMRNLVAYQGFKNSIVEWTLSDAWTTAPGRLHVRGACIERMLGPSTAITRFVVRGAVSGEIPWR